jgi:hypothetical protein
VSHAVIFNKPACFAFLRLRYRRSSAPVDTDDNGGPRCPGNSTAPTLNQAAVLSNLPPSSLSIRITQLPGDGCQAIQRLPQRFELVAGFDLALPRPGAPGLYVQLIQLHLA